ncbi:Ctr copper transporter, partial [Pilobolus umbonatus]
MNSTKEDIMCTMNMLFNLDTTNVCIIYEWWHIRNTSDFMLSCVVVFCISAFYEYLRITSNELEAMVLQARKSSEQKTVVEHHVNVDVSTAEIKEEACLGPLYQLMAWRSVVYALLLGISFWLMLVFMTYNGYLMITVILGAGCGHLIFNSSNFEDK